jgi:hypothetical protein
LEPGDLAFLGATISHDDLRRPHRGVARSWATRDCQRWCAGLHEGAVCPSAVATLRGHAVKSIGGPLRNIFVRVREARFGRIVDSALTNHVGAYAAKGLELGNHIVEIGGLHQTPLATTSLISVNAGAG